MMWPTCPTVYEINTWVWLHNLSWEAKHPVTLGNVPETELKRLADYGFDAIWLMGVWQRSKIGRKIAQEHSILQEEYRQAVPDYSSEDVIGSPYAISNYQVDSALGSNQQLAALRQRLRENGLRLILDFIPNHLARDHHWLIDYPERFIQGTLDDLQQAPLNYFTANDGRVLAHGRDPYFDGWSDTVQLDYRQQDTRQAMADLLLEVAGHCDGVRCDMAMLLIHDVFLQTWGGDFYPPDAEFWPMAIKKVKESHNDFLMMAEVYWGLESELQKMGFDYTYDKDCYDYLLGGQVKKVRIHLCANLKYQFHLVRFIENHDEKRALEAFGDPRRCQAAATIALTLPGMRLFHEGQFEGYRLKLPVQLGRRHSELIDEDMEAFYRRLLAVLRDPVFHNGQWRLLTTNIPKKGKLSYGDLIAYQWTLGTNYRLIVVNFSPDPAQCFLPLEISGVEGNSWRLHDLMNDSVEYIANGDELSSRGLYLNMPAYGYNIFKLDLQSTR